MNPSSHHIKTARSARYFTLGELAGACEIWVVLHGYGHLAEEFVKNFEPVLQEKTCIIAPEGLSRFYLRGFGGKIGASWMTREDRQFEIDDYIEYLDNLYTAVIKPIAAKRIIGVGFSQGGPALLRWLANGVSTVTDALLWSADIPRDLKFENYLKVSKKTKNWLIYSTSDPIVRQEIYDESISLFAAAGIALDVLHFEGGHEIPTGTLLELSSKLRSSNP